MPNDKTEITLQYTIICLKGNHSYQSLEQGECIRPNQVVLHAHLGLHTKVVQSNNWLPVVLHTHKHYLDAARGVTHPC